MDSVLAKMLETQPKIQRAQLKSILESKGHVEILCNSEECGGKVIGSVYPGKIVVSEWMVYRWRYDGKLGVECRHCGQDSKLARQEVGIISDTMPTRDDLLKLRDRLKADPTETIKIDENTEEVDGFLFRKVAV